MRIPKWRRDADPVEEQQDPDSQLQARWTGGSALATRVATIVLWSGLLTGPVALVLGFVGGPSAASQQPTGPAVADVDRSAEQAAVAEFAEHVVVTWLQTPRGSEDRLAGLVQGGGSAQLPEIPFVAAVPEVAGIEALEHGVWSLTVGVTVSGVSAEVEPERRYFQVPVRYDRGALVALTLPAPVPAPPHPGQVELGYEERANLGDATAVAAQEFLTALLTGTGDVTRYVTPGAQIAALSPAPYLSVEVDEVRTSEELGDPENPEDGQQVQVLVTAVATVGDQQAITVQYALALAARAGRWEVAAIEPAPAVPSPEPGGSPEPLITAPPSTNPSTGPSSTSSTPVPTTAPTP